MKEKITVVIPTYNTMLLLKETLDSLVKQTVSKEFYEIIVVDDGSKDGTRFLVDEYREKLDINYYYLEDKGFRLSAARNVGIRYAKYPVVLIFDCGMLASPQLLSLHMDAHQGQSKNVVIGLSYGVEEFSMENAQSLKSILDNNSFSRAFSVLTTRKKFYDCRYDHCKSVGFDLSKTAAPWVICWGGHISCRTKVLRDVGGFDEWFNSWGGEDVDIAIRLHNAGCHFRVLETLEAIHIPHFRSAKDNINSSQENIKYIVEKNRSPGVAMLSTHGWEDIFTTYLYDETEAVLAQGVT